MTENLLSVVMPDSGQPFKATGFLFCSVVADQAAVTICSLLPR